MSCNEIEIYIHHEMCCSEMSCNEIYIYPSWNGLQWNVFSRLSCSPWYIQAEIDTFRESISVCRFNRTLKRNPQFFMQFRLRPLTVCAGASTSVYSCTWCSNWIHWWLFRLRRLTKTEKGAWESTSVCSRMLCSAWFLDVVKTETSDSIQSLGEVPVC